ncbi:lipopolysaccharide biosynthesis protein [Phocaeicola sp.]
MGGRVHKSLLNARVNLVFYFLSLFFAFFSRKIFLNCLGADFIGLTGTLGNILGYLNLAEFGVGGAISFFLFKPIQMQDRDKINEILSVFGYLYRRIGQVILGVGIMVSLFFPLIFGRTEIGFGIIYFAFFSFLGSSLIGYFINYRQLLLTADQKNYVVAIYFQSANIVRIVLQIFLAYTYHNLYAWVAIEFLFAVIGCVILNWKINKEYPWLHTNIAQGKVLLQKYPDILKNTKLVFIHKLKDFLLSRSDEIMVFAFVSLKMVAFYGNYTMIVSKLSLLFTSILDGVHSGVGNLVAEGDKKNMMKVFWELMAIRHFIAGFMVFSIFFLMEPFITLWLGQEYVMDRWILLLMLVYLYISQSRGVIDMFNHAHGLYADTWSAWTELVLNVSITVVFGLKYGISGILLGKIVSTFFIIVLWKPYYLFNSGFHLPIADYWKGTIRYYLIFGVAFTAGKFSIGIIHLNPYHDFGELIGFAAYIVTVYLLVDLSLLYVFGFGTKSILGRLKRRK